MFRFVKIILGEKISIKYIQKYLIGVFVSENDSEELKRGGTLKF